MVRQLTKITPVRTSIDSQHVKSSKRFVKSSCEHFYQLFPSLWEQIICNISPWLKFEIIGVFVNIWSADYKYPVPVCENLPFLIQMQLSEKQNTFSEFFIPFMECPSNFKHVQKKEDSHSQCVSEINDCLRVGWTTH